MSTLFAITGEIEQLYQLAIDDEIDEQVFEDTLEALMGELEVKASGYCNVIKQLEMEEDTCDAMEYLWHQKKLIRKNHIKRMKEAAMNTMIRLDLKSIDAGDFTLKLQKNGGKQPLVVDGDVPESMCKVILEPDKDKIREAIENGENLPYAHLEERGQHIVIK